MNGSDHLAPDDLTMSRGSSYNSPGPVLLPYPNPQPQSRSPAEEVRERCGPLPAARSEPRFSQPALRLGGTLGSARWGVEGGRQ